VAVIDVLVVGDANPDLILRGDVLPRFGQAEQLVDSADVVLGGSAAITAHALARLGRPTRLSALTGTDAFGELTVRLLNAAGVDTTSVTQDPDLPTGLTVVLSRPDERAILTFLGAIPRLTPAQADASLVQAADEGARHLHISSFYLQPELAAGLPGLLEHARSLGLTTSLDTNFDPAERWDGLTDALTHLDLLLPNRTEVIALAARLSGTAIDDPIVAATLLAARGPVVVIKDGAHGAARIEPGGSVLHQAATPVTPVDTTGAGDTFNAAYLDSMLSGRAPAECLRRAVRAGAFSTSRAGGTAGQPTAAQLDPAIDAITDPAAESATQAANESNRKSDTEDEHAAHH
jgi:ribokinase